MKFSKGFKRALNPKLVLTILPFFCMQLRSQNESYPTVSYIFLNVFAIYL